MLIFLVLIVLLISLALFHYFYLVLTGRCRPWLHNHNWSYWEEETSGYQNDWPCTKDDMKRYPEYERRCCTKCKTSQRRITD